MPIANTSQHLPPCPTYTKPRVVYLSFFLLAPLTFAVPRRVFCLFLRCLPVKIISIVPAKVQTSQHVAGTERTLLSAWLLNLRRKSNTNESVMWLEFLQCLGRIVDEGKTGRLSTTKLGLETENIDLVLVGLVELSKLCS